MCNHFLIQSFPGLAGLCLSTCIGHQGRKRGGVGIKWMQVLPRFLKNKTGSYIDFCCKRGLRAYFQEMSYFLCTKIYRYFNAVMFSSSETSCYSYINIITLLFNMSIMYFNG